MSTEADQHQPRCPHMQAAQHAEHAEPGAAASRCPVPGPRWFRRVMAGTFLFFLLKGLVWLGLGVLAAIKLSG
ncbi:MAG: hypothetical protein ACR2GY_11120 [Phycisphaerales bacterium]